MWQEEKERQQQGDREAGRIGYIGNEGPFFTFAEKMGCLFW